MKDLSHRKTFSKAWRLATISFATSMALAERVYAQKDPWDQAVQVLQTAFTGPIATGLALVAIVVGGLMFAFGEGAAKRTLAGVIFGVGMAVGAVNFMSWLFP
jgi:type IV secretion system protein TrbC